MTFNYQPNLERFPEELASLDSASADFGMHMLTSIEGNCIITVSDTVFRLNNTEVAVDYLYFCSFVKALVDGDSDHVPLFQENYPLIHAWRHGASIILTKFGDTLADNGNSVLGRTNDMELIAALESAYQFEIELRKFNNSIAGYFEKFRRRLSGMDFGDGA